MSDEREIRNKLVAALIDEGERTHNTKEACRKFSSDGCTACRDTEPYIRGLEFALNTLHEIERLSPPLAPVLEWRDRNLLMDEHSEFTSGRWRIYNNSHQTMLLLSKVAGFDDGEIVVANGQSIEKLQLLASSIQRLLDQETELSAPAKSPRGEE